ncbi:MAG: flagellar biosynthesis protein FlhB [Planctomycetaceae bacterium]|nr:flagellar biosynthesis protein FlhB [Planctomycetaceae bacterium]
MADSSASDKTEKPTYRKLQKAHEQGQVAQSEELPNVVAILALVMVLFVFAPDMLRWFVQQMKIGMSAQNNIFTDSETFIKFFKAEITSAITILMPVFAALVVGGILSCLVVSGIHFSSKALVPKFDQINPVNGFKRLFNLKALVKLAISIAKLIFISVIVWKYLQGKIESLALIRWAWTGGIIVAISNLILGMLTRICIAILIIALADVAFQKWKYIRDLMMTKQELKQERKDMEGSPEIKSRVRRIQMEMAKKRMLKDVATANVVLVNPTHVAVALKYNPKTMDAPIMVAKGADLMAEKIREIARAYGVPIIRRPEIARAIYYGVKKPGDTIPQKLYAAVAEILAMIYRLRRRGA